MDVALAAVTQAVIAADTVQVVKAMVVLATAVARMHHAVVGTRVMVIQLQRVMVISLITTVQVKHMLAIILTEAGGEHTFTTPLKVVRTFLSKRSKLDPCLAQERRNSFYALFLFPALRYNKRII